jgi:hypothetical protein
MPEVRKSNATDRQSLTEPSSSRQRHRERLLVANYQLEFSFSNFMGA